GTITRRRTLRDTDRAYATESVLGRTPRTIGPRADLLLRLQELRQRVRHPAGLQRRRPDRVSEVRRQPAQALRLGGSRLQGVRLLSHRLAQGGGGSGQGVGRGRSLVGFR